VTAGGSGLSWSSLAAEAGAGTVYDVVRTDLDALPIGGAGETCVEPGSADTEATDGTLPDSGSGFAYVVRGRNRCGNGTYGFETGGNERITAACP